MTFIRYKTFGKQEYAYQIKSYWDSKTQRPKQKTLYLGVVVDKSKKIFEKRLSLPKQEKLILDFGDSYFIKEFFEKVKFSKNIFLPMQNQMKGLLSTLLLCLIKSICP